MLHQHVGFPIRTFPGQWLLGTSPELIAPCSVLLRLLVSRHPPCALFEIAYGKNTKLCFCLYIGKQFFIAYYPIH